MGITLKIRDSLLSTGRIVLSNRTSGTSLNLLRRGRRGGGNCNPLSGTELFYKALPRVCPLEPSLGDVLEPPKGQTECPVHTKTTSEFSLSWSSSSSSQVAVLVAVLDQFSGLCGHSGAASAALFMCERQKVDPSQQGPEALRWVDHGRSDHQCEDAIWGRGMAA